MRIDIFADTICPWCFIGKRRLERALALIPQRRIIIYWRPFQLNPDMPETGMDRNVYLAAKFGGTANAVRTYQNIARAGESEGLAFAFNKIARTPNTRLSHELLAHAAPHGLQNALIENLFRLYFFEGADIGNLQVLLQAAADLGLDPHEAEEALQNGWFRQQISTEERQGREAGLQGVPAYVFNGQHLLSGAQDPKVLMRMLDLARENEALSGRG